MLAVRFSKAQFDLREPSKPAKQRRMRVRSLKSDIGINTDCKLTQHFFDLKNLQYIYALKQPNQALLRKTKKSAF